MVGQAGRWRHGVLVHGAVEGRLVWVNVRHDAADGAHHVGIDGGANEDAADDVRALQRRLRRHVPIPAASRACSGAPTVTPAGNPAASLLQLQRNLSMVFLP